MEHELKFYRTGSELERQAREKAMHLRLCMHDFDAADPAFHIILETLQLMSPEEYNLARDMYDFRELYNQVRHYVKLLELIRNELERLEAGEEK